MNKLRKSIISETVVALVFLLLLLTLSAASSAEYPGPSPLQSQLSSDERTAYNAVPPVVYVADPYPPAHQVSIPARFDLTTMPETATANFSITYVADGGTDAWDEPCYTFPEAAKTAFNAAAAIWGNLLQSSVPITIRACWANLGSSSILGYSGGGNLHRNFTGAPLTNTWYSESLANALHGSDLNSTAYDMHITYNNNFSWYYGIDGQTPSGQYDLMSVVLHEIAHGLNFAGSMRYTGGSGSWGYATGYPNIYDRFVRDGTVNPGNLLIDTNVYANPSTALGNALTSSNIWFHGANAMAANGGERVRLYAPYTWSGGSSYSHLDYSTFAGGPNRLMVYAMSSGVSTHDPGPVTLGLLKDMGWPMPPSIGAWNRITWSNPETIAAAGSYVYGDFGPGGVGYGGIWRYDGSTWTQITWSNPETIAAAGSYVYGDFGPGGVGYGGIWRYDGSTWTQITRNNPETIAAAGSYVYGDFGSNGIWRWDSGD